MQALKIVLFIVTAIGLFQSAEAQQSKQVTPGGTKFFLYTPPSYSPPTGSPVLIALHGAGTIGNNLDSMLIYKDEIPAKLISINRWDTSRPFIVVTPQLKRDPTVPDYRDQLFSPAMIDELLEYVKLNWSVDPNRVYITGLSLGGASTWLYAAAHPDKVAAIVPISGVTDSTQACLIKDIPVWAFHGGMDDLVPNVYSKGMVNNINQCTPRAYTAQLNILHARRHEGWNEIYNLQNGYDIYSWLLKFTKNNLSNKSPYVNAGADLKLLSRSTPLSLYGEYFDSDGTVTSIAWTQLSGPAVTLEGTTTRWLKLSNLVTGTYVFQFAATDDDGVQSTDQVTIQILNSTPAGQAAISDLILINGVTNQDIGPLSEGYIIDPVALGTNQFNIRAVPTSVPQQSSVKLGVNGDQGTRVTNPPGPYYIIGRPSGSEPEWLVANGDYRICAIPYDARSGYGNPGVASCYNIKVVNLTPGTRFFYAKALADISLLTSWGMNTDGTGTKPLSFSSDNQIFVINTTVSTSTAINITGSGSKLWVRSGGSLTINNQFSTLNADANATVTINTSQPVTFGTMHPASIINFGANVTSIPAFQYGNLTLTGAGTTKNLSAGTTQVSGNLTIDSGVTLNANASLLTIGGNFTNNGTFGAGTGTVTLNGSAAQALTGITTFNNLIISKSGSVTLSGTGPTTVNNTLTLTTGNIISSSGNKLIIPLSGTINGGSASAFIDGPLVKTLGASGTFMFPIGDVPTLRYRPATLANTSASDTWTAEYQANNPSSDGYSTAIFNSSTLTSVSQFEYWNISRAASASASLTLSYNTGSYTPPNIGDASKLRIAHWDNTKWDIPTGGGSISRTGNNVSGTVTVTNVTTFSPYTIGVFDVPLPVKWLSFEGRRSENSIELVWKTSIEVNNDHFEIERSVDGAVFNTIGLKPSAGNRSVIQRYDFTDHEVSRATSYYYRIKQVDFDGIFDYSDMIFISGDGKSNGRWVVYPNPIRPEQQFRLELQDKSVDPEAALHVQVISAQGRVIFEGSGALSILENNLEQVFKNVDTGIYLITLHDGAFRQQLRVTRY
jgi:poly(3-hydroxybutyrate) depolymerase